VKTTPTWSYSLLVAALMMSGCAKFDIRKNIPWGEGSNGRIEQPMRVEAVWVDTVQTKGEQKPTRGFGGRLYFFGPNNSQDSVKVAGTLVIYGFDDTNRDPTNVVPNRKVVYPPKEFETLYSKSKLGHSYSVWVPWDEAGGERKEITLIARFVPKTGAVITSEQIKVLLPGTTPLIDVQNVTSRQSGEPPRFYQSPPAGAPGEVQQASYQQADNQRAAPDNQTSELTETKRELISHTIPLLGSQTAYFIQRPVVAGSRPLPAMTTLPQPIEASAVAAATNEQPVLSQAAPPPSSAGLTTPLQSAAVSASPLQTPHSAVRPLVNRPRSTHFEHVRPPVQAAQAARQLFGHVPSGQPPAEPLSGHSW
jgi:hypothetical protein